MNAIELEHVKKHYRQGSTDIPVFDDLSLVIGEGEKVAIVGASGSGKTTLLSLMAAMDTPESGSIRIFDEDLSRMSQKDLSRFRNNTIAVIFQSFELVPAFTALENVMLPLDIRKAQSSETDAKEALKRVGLSHRIAHTPQELSGGEEQRVAIARALAQSPRILFADEPTGNLDRKTGDEILSLLLKEIDERKMTFVVITHDPEIAKHMDRVLVIENGTITESV